MKNIKTTEYLQVVGLLKLAENYYKTLQDIEKALGTLLNIEQDGYGHYGHVSDAVYGNDDFNADTLLKYLNLKVENNVAIQRKKG